MAQVQHTPGPWELDIEEYGFRIRMGSAVPYTGIYEPQHVIEWDPGVYPSEDQDEADAEHRQYLEAKANMERIVAAVNAVEGIPTEALEAGVVRKLIEAATRYLAATMRESDDDPNCWFEKEFAKAWLREVLAKVWGLEKQQS